MGIHKIFESPLVFKYSQKLNPWTVGQYRDFAVANVPYDNAEAVLDIGCGLGAHKPLFPGARYTGVDLNPAYIDYATRHYGDGFYVMDAGAMSFEESAFDHALSVATCHHLDDGIIERMAREVLRVLKPGGAFHIIDPILPRNPNAALKHKIFMSDRGRNQRTFEEMTELLSRFGRLAKTDCSEGPLHDVGYFRLVAA